MNGINKIGAEVYEVLRNIPEDKRKRIPQKLLEIFDKYKEYSNGIIIDINKKFEEQNISKEAKEIIFAISLNYWLTEEDKRNVIKELNEKEKVKFIKYDPEQIFNKQKEELLDSDKPSKITKEKKWFTNIVNKIKKIFKV